MEMQICGGIAAILVGAFYIFAGFNRWDLSGAEKVLSRGSKGFSKFLMGNNTRWEWQIGLGMFFVAIGLFMLYRMFTGQY